MGYIHVAVETGKLLPGVRGFKGQDIKIERSITQHNPLPYHAFKQILDDKM